MPSTGLTSGNNVKLFKSGVMVGCARSVTFNATADQLSAACKEDGEYTKTIAGSKSWTLELEGAWIPDATIDLFDWAADFKANTELIVSFGTNLAGDKQITGKVRVTSFSAAGPENALATYNVTLSGQGEFNVITLVSPY